MCLSVGWFLISEYSLDLAIPELQFSARWSVPLHFQHPGAAGAGDPPGDGAQGLESGRGLLVRGVGWISLDQSHQARGLPVRSQWGSVRPHHGAPRDLHHEPQGDVPPLGQGGRGQSYSGH